MEPLRAEKRYTYADYLSWDTPDRYELIDGVPRMLAAPRWEHQGIGGNLFFQLYSFLQGKPCRVFNAPFDVRLNPEEGDDTVVQPDVVVICDRSKLKGTGCVGAPDLVIEIISPSTSNHDKVTKFGLYLRAGVREYWIIDPSDRTALVHTLENGKYTTAAYAGTGDVPVGVLDGCVVHLTDVFAE